MTVDLFWTVIHKAINRNEKRPLELLSLVFGAAAFVVATRLTRFGTAGATTSTQVATADSDTTTKGDAVSSAA